jgi:dTDP-4-amino-4,6-dideoxygalactose transaminase
MRRVEYLQRASVASERLRRMSTPVAVYRPQLPDADRLLPYLRRIDASRIYTNWGPLATELELRLANHFGLPDCTVVSAGSGTSALVGAILASAGRAKPQRRLAIVPNLTFVATAIAVEQCGYQPYVVDIDPESWTLDLRRLEDHALLSQIGLVVVVAAFGRPVVQEACLAFRRRTGVPVVIDGGASFEAISADPVRYLGDIPAGLSFHATKSFATGEGGCVVTTNRPLATLVTQALNFGFDEVRNSASASTNGKMSEYHAAVGLAELDGWAQKCQALATVANSYRQRLNLVGLTNHFVGAPAVAGCYALFGASNVPESARLQQSLSRSDVEFRLWYGDGLLKQRYFADLPHDSLDVSERMAPLLIGLPMATDLPNAVIDRVIAALKLPDSNLP